MKGPNLVLESTIFYRDDIGFLVPRHHRIEETNSWVKSAAAVLYAFLKNGTVSQSAEDLTQNQQSLDGAKGEFMSAAFAVKDNGIIVGTGTTPPTTDDFDTETDINDGTSSGRLAYQKPQSILGPTAISGGYRVTMQRNFDNQSGGTIVVGECAVVVRVSKAASTVFNTMMIRDLVSPTLSVADSELLELKYHFDFKV